MCKCKIPIFNNSNYVNLHSFDVCRYVPCGKCVECQSQKQIEYAIRGYFEYKECFANGGFAYWDTLTYNDAHLPKYLGFPCFCKKDVQDFFHRLRRLLATHYDIQDSALRYFVTCEYGEQHKRPHYHVIFFVHSNLITPTQFHALLVRAWRNCKKKVQKVNKNGKFAFHRDGSPIYVYERDVRGNTDLKHAANPSSGVLKNNAAITYVSKYVVKEDTYVMTLCTNINEALQERGYLGLCYDSYKEHFQPWHLQSVGFGSYLEKCLDQRKYIRDLSCVVPVGADGEKTISKKYSLPMYYLRRLFYSRITLPDGRESWVRKLGLRQKLYKQEKESFNDFVNSTESQIKSIDHLYSLLDHEAKQTSFSRLKKKVEDFKSAYPSRTNNLSDCIKSCLGDYDIRSYCTFCRYFSTWFEQGRDELDPDSILLTRLFDDGSVLNPLKEDKRFRRFMIKNIVARNDEKYKPLSDLHNLMIEIQYCFSQYRLDVEEEKREKKRELRALTLIQ